MTSIVDVEPPAERVNVLMLDHDPVKAARAHCDLHVTKLPLETARLLSAAWHVLHPELVQVEWRFLAQAAEYGVREAPPEGDEATPAHYTALFGQRVYRATHEHHPCAVWARELGGNYEWLWRLGVALCDELRYRFGRAPTCLHALRSLEWVPPALRETYGTWTEVPPAVPATSKVLDGDCYDSVASYRAYYRNDKAPVLRYTKRKPPEWLNT